MVRIIKFKRGFLAQWGDPLAYNQHAKHTINKITEGRGAAGADLQIRAPVDVHRGVDLLGLGVALQQPPASTTRHTRRFGAMFEKPWELLGSRNSAFRRPEKAFSGVVGCCRELLDIAN